MKNFNYKNGDKVTWKSQTENGTGVIKGVCASSQVIIGATFIVQPDENVFDWDCIPVFEMDLELINEN